VGAAQGISSLQLTNQQVTSSKLNPLLRLASPRRYTKEFTLSNCSEVPMKFSWRVPEDEGCSPPEFQVNKAQLCITVCGSSPTLLAGLCA
jgi:hypothetical protein